MALPMKLSHRSVIILMKILLMKIRLNIFQGILEGRRMEITENLSVPTYKEFEKFTLWKFISQL